MLRCRGKRHAEVLAPDLIEVKCDSRVCGAGNGNVVLHRFKVSTGELVETLRFKNPKGVSNDSIDHGTHAIRAS